MFPAPYLQFQGLSEKKNNSPNVSKLLFPYPLIKIQVKTHFQCFLP